MPGQARSGAAAADISLGRAIPRPGPSSLPFAGTLHNCDVTINRQVGNPLDFRAGPWPSYFYPVKLLSLSDAKHHSRIMRREKTASSDLHPLLLQVASLVSDAGAYGIDVRRGANELDPEPMVLTSNRVA